MIGNHHGNRYILKVTHRVIRLSLRECFFVFFNGGNIIVSFGVLFWALLLPLNRFFGIVDVYGTSLTSCSIYLGFAMFITSMYKMCLYVF